MLNFKVEDNFQINIENDNKKYLMYYKKNN